MPFSTKRLVGVLALLLVLNSAQAVPLLNGGQRGRLPAPNLSSPQLQQRSLDIDEAIAIAERRYDGRAVSARHIGNGVYRVRILQDDGKVKTVTIRGGGGRY